MTEKDEQSVVVTDVTLREFGQNVPASHVHLFTPTMRAKIALELIEAGFKNLEVFSCVSPKVAPAMNKQDMQAILKEIGRLDEVQMITLVPNRTGYNHFLGMELGPDGYNHSLGIFFSAIEDHNLANLGRSIEETLSEYREIVRDAEKRRIRIVGYISAVFGYLSPQDGILLKPRTRDVNRYIDLLLDLGLEEVTLSDLQGVADDKETGRVLQELLEERKGKNMDMLGYHPHHLSGCLALANSRTAYDLGVRRFDGSLGGTGGCVTGAPGNQPSEGLVDMFSRMGVKTGLDQGKVFALAKRVEREVYSQIPLTKG